MLKSLDRMEESLRLGNVEISKQNIKKWLTDKRKDECSIPRHLGIIALDRLFIPVLQDVVKALKADLRVCK